MATEERGDCVSCGHPEQMHSHGRGGDYCCTGDGTLCDCSQYVDPALLPVTDVVRMAQSLAAIAPGITEWGDATFPKSNRHTVLSHLREEIAEFLAVAEQIPDRPQYDEAEECADVVILMIHFAHKVGFDLFGAVSRKMEFNRMRIWKTEPEPGGHWKHVEN